MEITSFGHFFPFENPNEKKSLQPEKQRELLEVKEDLYDLDLQIDEREFEPHQVTLNTYTCGTCAKSVCPCYPTEAGGSACNC